MDGDTASRVLSSEDYLHATYFEVMLARYSLFSASCIQHRHTHTHTREQIAVMDH